MALVQYWINLKTAFFPRMNAQVQNKKVYLTVNWTNALCSVSEAMEEYLVLVYAGLTGSVTMITCTVLALTRLVFEYKGDSQAFWKCSRNDSCSLWPSPSKDAIEVNTLEQLLHNICLLLSSRTREIVKAALGFVKVILFILDPKRLASHTTVLVCTNFSLPPATDTQQSLFLF